MQLPPEAFPARQGLGTYLDRLTAPQPRGPMAQEHLTTTGTQDADLILFQTQTMKMLEVPSCSSFHVNKFTQECVLGSISSGQRPTYQLSIGLSEFIVKQAPYPPSLYLKQKPNVKTLWHDTWMLVSHTRLIVPFPIPAPRYWCASPRHQKTEKLGDVFRVLLKSGCDCLFCVARCGPASA